MVPWILHTTARLSEGCMKHPGPWGIHAQGKGASVLHRKRAADSALDRHHFASKADEGSSLHSWKADEDHFGFESTQPDLLNPSRSS